MLFLNFSSTVHCIKFIYSEEAITEGGTKRPIPMTDLMNSISNIESNNNIRSNVYGCFYVLVFGPIYIKIGMNV